MILRLPVDGTCRLKDHFGASVVACADGLTVVGGYSFTTGQFVPTVKRYNRVKSQWEMIGRVNNVRCAAVVPLPRGL